MTGDMQQCKIVVAGAGRSEATCQYHCDSLVTCVAFLYYDDRDDHCHLLDKDSMCQESQQGVTVPGVRLYTKLDKYTVV